MWYLSLLAHLQDLLHFSFGYRKDLESNKDEVGQERVVLAWVVDTSDLDEELEVVGRCDVARTVMVQLG